MSGRITTGDEVTADLKLSCDVCIVGSGSGGAWLAHELCARGLDVVMLEEGGYHTRREFDLTEANMYPKLYQELGNRTTDDLSMTLLQGRSVGGSTTVNWCSSFRTPERILKVWREVHGLSLSQEQLTPHWEAAEKRLHIQEWPEALINRNNRILWEGLGKLGYERGLIKRNVNGCANLGYCGLGCPIDAKQSMGVTVLPDRGGKRAASVLERLGAPARRAGAARDARCGAGARRREGRADRAHGDGRGEGDGGVRRGDQHAGAAAAVGAVAEGRVGKRTWLQPGGGDDGAVRRAGERVLGRAAVGVSRISSSSGGPGS